MFDLKQAIRKWRESLNGNEALEDGAKEELENHLRDKIDYLRAKGASEAEAFEEAVLKIGDSNTIGTEYYKATTLRLSGRPPWKERQWMPSLMHNYLKIGLRKIKRLKIFSLINIAGLAVGLACCAVIILYVSNELTFDTFHKDKDRIYRIGTHVINQVGENSSSTSPGPLGSMLKSTFPQVEESTRVVPPYENSENVLVVRGDKRFFENRLFFVDNSAFRIFHMPFLKGGRETALIRPHTVVLTEAMSEKYFDEEDPIGRILQIEIDYDTGQVELQDYEVTGVIKNAPANTHFKYDMLLSMPTFIVNLPSFDEDWINFHEKYTYIKLGPKTDAVGSGAYPAFILTSFRPTAVMVLSYLISKRLPVLSVTNVITLSPLGKRRT
ncbi:MAG: ABC transporter permease [Acidobacteria bacterium]|nr:ABC transporter permease [Acidobacteriota bacterium]